MTKIRNEINNFELEEYLRGWLKDNSGIWADIEFPRISSVMVASMRDSKELMNMFGVEWVAYNEEKAYTVIAEFFRQVRLEKGKN